MSLSPGDRLGPYKIVAPIGSGGMGEVYQAIDTRLGRTIAVKISTEQFGERFAQEARAVAALNHPNICTLHDVGPDYLVMEYIDGQPLKGPLPLDQAIRYACQICDALDAAHRKGIVHRDLKPANILITKTGAKLLDFGLAKRSREAGVGGATATMAITKEHTVLGTLQYMSPEQLEGKEADSRSDIFSFGLVLHEMLNGKHPFEGSSPASVIAAILEREPPPLGNSAPPALDRVLRRCLAKNPDDRWQTARDLKAALQWTIEAGPTGAPPRVASPWRARAGWVVAGVAAIVAISLVFMSRPELPAGELVRFGVYPPEGTVFARTNNATIPIPQFALSPNGKSLAFTATAGAKATLWVRSLDQTAARQVAGTEGALGPFWSPDSLSIGFFVEGRIKRVLAGGGPIQTVAENIFDPRGASWGSDDTILYSDGSEGLLTISATGGGHSKVVTSLDASQAEKSHRWPQLLPDSRHYLLTIRSAPSRGLYAASLDGSNKKQLVPADSSGKYASPGFLLWVEGERLLGQPFEAARLNLTGQPFTVAEGVGNSTTAESAVSASSSGIIAYSGAISQEGRLTWFDRSGTQFDSPVPGGDYSDFRPSPDGRRLAVSRVDMKTGGTKIWLTDLVRQGRPDLFISARGVNASATWSPDGSAIAFRTNRDGLIELYRKSAFGGSEAVLLSVEAERAAGLNATTVCPSDWSSDGHSIVAAGTGRGTGYDLWLIPVAPGEKPTKFLGSASDEIQGSFSPDGSLVAYASNETGRFEVYVRLISGPDRRWLVSTGGGYEPRWRADGHELYYLSEDGRLMAVPVGAGPSIGAPKVLFQTKVAGVDAFRTHYVPTRDGQRFLVNIENDPKPNPITVVLNWTAGLRK